MGLTDTLKNIFMAPAGGTKPAQTKQDVYPQVHSVYENTPRWPTFNFKNVDREGFKSNAVVYSGIRRIVQTFSEAPLIVQDDDDEQIPNHPLANLTSTPNEFMTETELFEITLIHWFISGNGVWGLVRDSNNDIAELWPLRPDRVRILPSRENFIEKYIYEIGGDYIEIPTEDIVHFRFPDPSDAYWGQPPLQAAFKEIALDNESVDFNKTILQNYGVPGTVMKFEEEPDEDERERMARRFKQKFGGSNRGKPAFVGKETEIESIGLDPKKLALPDTSDISETRVLMTLGVPPIVINAMSGLERSTFENTSQAWRWFYQATISPLHRRFSDRIDKNLMGEFRDGTSTDFDQNQVAALRQLRREDRELDLEEYKEGAITRAEYRRRRGMEVNEADDVYRTESRTIFRDPDGNGGPDPQQENIYDGLNDDKSEHDHPHDEKILTPDEKEFKSHFPNGIENLKDSLPRDDQTEVIRDVLNRRKIAEEYIGPLKSWAVQEFELQRDDMMAVWANSTKALDQEQFEKLRRELMRKQSEWRRRMVMGSEEINPFAQVMRPLIEKSARSAAEVVGASFTVSNERVTQFVREYTYKFAQNMAQTSVDKLRGIIREAMDEGLSIRNTRDLLDEEFTSWTTDRAELVARSETTRAANAGAQFSYQEAGVQQKQWLAATDACPYCADLDGTVVSTQANFLDEGTSFFPDGASSPLQISYGNVGYPPVHPNCLPGDSLVSPRGRITGVSKRFFDGDIIVIKTAAGDELTATPNHPVLTPGGFVAADTIDVGGKVVNRRFRDGEVVVNRDDVNEPTRIENIAESFLSSSDVSAIPVPMSSKDFHGDGRNGDVAIIGTDRSLEGSADISFGELIHNFPFVVRNVQTLLFNGVSPFTLLRKTYRSTFSSFMSSFDLFASLFIRHVFPFELFRFASATNGNTTFFESSFDGMSGDVKGLRKFFEGFAAFVSGNDLINRQVSSSTRTTAFDSGLFESSVDSGLGDSITVSEIGSRQPLSVITDEVVSVNVRSFSGHVYNLQTTKGYYEAENIITHNCRCTIVPVVG